MRARKARLSDATAIHALIAGYAADGILLPRTESNIRDHIATFLVLEERSRIAGCVSLESYGPGLAEIRSLAVNPEIRGRGQGGKLVDFALAEAQRKRIARVFAVTHTPDFFVRHGFVATSRRALPEKIERDCCTCAKAKQCRLTAVIATVLHEEIALPILESAASAAPA
ncbi:MAG TPA: GNAT family N-acetyltransferase [Candidatus Acidoferrales bacterium]|nr:GNAT family N-acetyltransferase [Candidatus Acidoferrales bacterium]